MEEKVTFKLINSLLESRHGDFMSYVPNALRVAREDPSLYSHFATYYFENSKIRDGKVALPIIGLYGFFDEVLSENLVAQLARLGPRELYKAYMFHRQMNKDGNAVVPGNGALLKRAGREYLRSLESKPGVWDYVASRSRDAMTGLYAMLHVQPSDRAKAILFERNYPEDSVFWAAAHLRDMPAEMAAAAIAKFHISPQIVTGALGNALDTKLLIAMIDQMTGSEIVNYAKFISDHAGSDGVVAAALDEALTKAANDKRVAVTKISKAAEAVGGDVAAKLTKTQEVIFDKNVLGGRWAVLLDRSSSMSGAIALGKGIAAALARMVDEVHMTFFNATALHIDASKMSFAEITNACRGISASGMTSIGAGLEILTRKGIAVDAIVLVSDGGENSLPRFSDAYKKYVNKFDVSPDIYYIRIGQSEPGKTFMRNLDFEEMSGAGVDAYSLPNLIASMKSDKYLLLDEIRNSRLWALEDALKERG